MKAVRAIFQNGMFRPLDPVDLPEMSEVVLEPLQQPVKLSPEGLARIHEILSLRFDSGETDVAARHDEHQP